MEKKQYIDIKLVKELMEKLHLDNKALAEKMGVTPATVKRLLDGADQNHLGGDVLLNIAKALGIPPHLLVHKDYC